MESSGVKTTDMVGLKFNRITVLSILPSSGDGRVNIIGMCDCGITKPFNSYAVRNGKTKSCGCYSVERAIETNTTHGYCNGKGEKVADEYKIWCGMKDRCDNPNNSHFSDYGGRGICYDKSWVSFISFIKDVGNRPSKEYSIDRIDVNGNYEKKNVRWATKKQQARNKRNNKWIEFDGKKMVYADWEEQLNIPKGKISTHIRKGKSPEYVLSYYKSVNGNIKKNANWPIKEGESHPLSKKVLCVTTGVEYISASDAGRKLGIGFGSICSVCRGRSKQVNGLVFKYI